MILDQTQASKLDEMKIYVPREANRQISFTNKEAAFYFTQSHVTNHQEHAYFEGMNIAKNRVFGGYTLYAGGSLLDNQQAKVWVYPYKMVRQHGGGLTEELWMFDHKNLLEVRLTGTLQTTMGITLKGEQLSVMEGQEHVATYRSMEGNFIIAVSGIREVPLHQEDRMCTVDAGSEGFYIAVGKTVEEALELIREARIHASQWKQERRQRMEQFLHYNAYVVSDDAKLTLALQWLHLTMDQLVTRQQGDGIYAGLPWFNEYWGRDQFIAMPGATLVTGQFETARHILLSFAKFQNTDETSLYYGRVPNILAPGNIDYHTTDGTPRFIIQLQDYVKYSGDTAVIEELYPAVVRSIEGSVKYWVDDKGYLMHADNETWMDARDGELKSYSPRDTRANDIQALWYNQLRSGIYFAEYMKEEAHVKAWTAIADRLKQHFEADFVNPAYPYLADRLSAEDEPEFSLRPNQLFAMDMVSDDDFKTKVTRTAWEELVYPWGVASLDRHHPFFHPFHLTHHYHKDAAYHNGAVWLWLNGIAMQRMIEAGQEEIAYELFKNMNWQALNLGVVGGLCENMDAYPHEGADWATLTGAYLQAWSNAEHLRVWYQYFLGIRPDLISHTLTIAPRVPAEITSLNYHANIGQGRVEAAFTRGVETTYRYAFKEVGLRVVIDLAAYDLITVDVAPNTELIVKQAGPALSVTAYDAEGQVLQTIEATESKVRVEQGKQYDHIMKGVTFAQPVGLENHPVMH
ncbi:amylo-alpha-1,6-glucosidase [Paenibacillus guangzhouensis]|uniref:amylo-alpha-1,6-glucosidase n=1 Tax=Paenibacillus guangzhouensis TaxID=1473112 RepID=UPI001266E16D|nr:amylo-alpha-1,6-glucosidase [Paenibacillus guangzhouensis]